MVCWLLCVVCDECVFTGVYYFSVCFFLCADVSVASRVVRDESIAEKKQEVEKVMK